MWRNFCATLIFSLSLSLLAVSEKVPARDFVKNDTWGIYGFFQVLEPYILQNYPFENVSKMCTNSLRMYVNGLIQGEPYAVKMFDATGKFPSGFLSGTNLELGSFENCLAVKAKSNNESELFKGQYCMVSLKTPLIYPMDRKTSIGKSYVETYGYPPDWIAGPMETGGGYLSKFGLYLGTCLPSTCSEQEIYNIIYALTKPAELSFGLSDCQVDEPRRWPLTAKIAISVVLLLIGMGVLGTTLDIRDRKKKEENVKFSESFNRKLVKAFSLRKNAEKLFETQQKNYSIDCFYGIRLWTCFLLIFGHTIVLMTPMKEKKYTNYFHYHRVLNIFTVILDNGLQLVENFYVISGFLLTYAFWRQLERSGGHINIIEILSQKFWRLTPAHIFTIILTFAIPVLHRGPTWNSAWEEETEKCINNGWMNLFYIHNFLDYREVCWTHTWYIGALLQIQAVSLLLMVFTYRYPKSGITVGLVMCAGCIFRDFRTSIKWRLFFPAFLSPKDFDLILLYMSKIYIKMFSHFTSHAIGMLLGWFVLKYKDRKFRKEYHVAGWILSIMLCLIVYFAVWYPTKNIELIAVYNSLRNILWSLAFSWLVYTCTTGSAGFLEKFFSYKALRPLSQVSYLAYLLHPLLLVFRDATLRHRINTGKLPHIVEGSALTMGTFPLAFIVYLMVEAPFNTIYDLWKENKSSLNASEESNNKSSVTDGIEFDGNVKSRKKEL